MKRIILFTAFVAALTFVAAAQDKSKRPSPPAVAEGTIDGVKVKVDYSQPGAKGRKVMGGLVPYGEVWRTGANEATVIEFDKNVKIEGQALAAGKYTLFTIPGENEWTIIFNKKTGQWGAYDYAKNKDQDALQVKVKSGKTNFTELFTISVDKDVVTLKWENTAVSFKVSKG
ncbi:MAG: DUF2911 domain-containing protein [Flammeovirgaceae bacterium]|nr:MAG: DUF2911 domain-containing protein [Flammeovirgaceae bacterium]